MKISNFENNDSSIYSDEEYEQFGNYGKEIFIPHNSNDNSNIIIR